MWRRLPITICPLRARTRLCSILSASPGTHSGYTVDFTYDGSTYSIAGESEIMLSELFGILKIDENVADVKSAEFSNPELVSVEQVEGDWKLTSLKPFQSEETLTVEMKSGATYVVKVTDAANTDNTFDVTQ